MVISYRTVIFWNILNYKSLFICARLPFSCTCTRLIYFGRIVGWVKRSGTALACGVVNEGWTIRQNEIIEI